MINHGSPHIPEEEKPKVQVSDIIQNIKSEGGDYIKELRPRDVTGDRNTFVFEGKLPYFLSPSTPIIPHQYPI